MLEQNNASVERLYEVILQLESVEECRRFFEDLCTIREVLDMAQRLDAAILLDNKVSYQNIAKDVKISTATIGRVSKCLNYGSGGYRLALDKLKAKQQGEDTE